MNGNCIDSLLAGKMLQILVYLVLLLEKVPVNAFKPVTEKSATPIGKPVISDSTYPTSSEHIVQPAPTPQPLIGSNGPHKHKDTGKQTNTTTSPPITTHKAFLAYRPIFSFARESFIILLLGNMTISSLESAHFAST